MMKELEQNKDVCSTIEQLRIKICKKVKETGGDLSHPDVVKLSGQLDEYLLKHKDILYYNNKKK